MTTSIENRSLRKQTGAIRQLDAARAREIVTLFARPVVAGDGTAAADDEDSIRSAACGQVTLDRHADEARRTLVKTIVVLSGAGISAESGLKTFRGDGGLWEGHRVEDVATPEAWARDPALVLEFYNERRRQVRAAQPNAAHKALAALERAYDVHVVTQNVDDLHERAGSSQVLHLHGEILLARSTQDPDYTKHLADADIQLGDTCPLGSQLRPHIVWFGEEVPALEQAARADVQRPPTW